MRSAVSNLGGTENNWALTGLVDNGAAGRVFFAHKEECRSQGSGRRDWTLLGASLYPFDVSACTSWYEIFRLRKAILRIALLRSR